MTRARVAAGRASVGEMAANLLGFVGLDEESSPEAVAGAIHIAEALTIYVRANTKG